MNSDTFSLTGTAKKIGPQLAMAVAIIAPFLLAVALYAYIRQPLMDVDSGGYLHWDRSRTAAYPLFLDFFEGPFLLPLQLVLWPLSLAWLVLFSSSRIGKVLAALCALAIAANPYLWQLQATIMTEAVTTPLLILLVGCIIGFAFSRRPIYLVAAGAICGLATAFRPSCLPLLVAPLCAIAIVPEVRRRLLLAALTVIVWGAPVAAERLYSKRVHGPELTSPLGRCAFMKAGVIDAPPVAPSSASPLDQLLAKALNDDYEPVRRLISRAPDYQVRNILLTNYESCFAWKCGDQLVKDIQLGRPEIDQAMWRIGLARLASNPVAYLELTATEYQRMWLLHPRKAPGPTAEYNAFVAREAPLPLQDSLGIESQPTPVSQQNPLLRVDRAGFALIGLIAAIFTILLAIWHRSALARVALCLLLATQAVLVTGNFIGVGLPRYAMGMWPLIITGLILGSCGLLEQWAIRFGAAKSPSRPEASSARASG